MTDRTIVPDLPPATAAPGNPIWAWWRERAISTVDHESVVRRIAEESGWDGRYAFLIVVSAGISILGLLLPSSAVLIGAMLLSPLMMPIIGLGFAIATLDFVEMRRAGIALGAGSLIAVLLTALFVALSPVQTVTSEIAIRTQPNLFDLLVALLSAIAGGYALIRGRGETVVGVAIAIALMPPLAVVGFGIATWNWTIGGGALLLFLTNLVTMAFTAAIMARLYGFGSHLTPRHTRLQGLLLLTGLVALAIPLGLALRQIAWETVAARQIRDGIVGQFEPGARLSEVETDFRSEPIRVVATLLTARPVADAARSAETELSRAFGRPVSIDLDQIRVDSGAGVEGAQIAAAQEGEREQVAARTVRRIGERLSLVAGIDPGAVLVDRDARRAVATATPLPGADLAAYRQLEARAATGEEGWSIALVPPLLSLPAVPFEDDQPTGEGFAAIELIAWAATRRAMPVGLSGPEADVARTIELLAARGVSATRVGSGATVTARWELPTG